MTERSPNHWRPSKTALIFLVLLGAYSVLVLYLWRGHDARPDPAVNTVVMAVLGVGAILAELHSYFVQLRGGQERLEMMQTGMNLDRAAAQSHLYKAVVRAIEDRDDIPTDRIIGVMRQATERVDARLAVLELAVQEHVCAGYSDGYADGLARVPADGERRHLKSINGKARS